MPVVRQANGGQNLPLEAIRERELRRRLSVLSELDRPLDRLAKWIAGGKKGENKPQITGEHLKAINELLPKVRNEVSRGAGGLSEVERAVVDRYTEFRHRTTAEGFGQHVQQAERARMLNLVLALEMMPVKKGIFASLFSRGKQRTYRDVFGDVLGETSKIKYEVLVREQAPNSREVRIGKREVSFAEAVHTAVYYHALEDREGGNKVRGCLETIEKAVLEYDKAVKRGTKATVAQQDLRKCLAGHQPKSTRLG